MERLCFTFEIYEGQEGEYKRRHDEIWPELVEVIQGSGLKNYSLFRRGTQIVAYVEAHPDVATAMAQVAASEHNTRWSVWFTDVIVSLVGDDGELQIMEEVWHLD
jgi:L-rhamnose mutarotase